MREALLSGEHATLPFAEVEALAAVNAPGARVERCGRVARIHADVDLGRAALIHAWGEPWADAPDDADGLKELAAAVRAHAPGDGSAAVVSQRTGHSKSPNKSAVERGLGSALVDAGHSIDLRNPQLAVYAWFADRLHVGQLLGTVDRTRYETRIPEHRRHFSPVSLHPRRAASLVHLARVPVGGTIYDPFCGTGGILLEAALDGYEVLGSDLDPRMVQGSLQALTDDGPHAVDGELFVADIGDAPSLVGPVDGIVSDLPYGAASSTHDEGLGTLYPRAMEAIRDMLRPGGRAVLGAPTDLPEVPGLRRVESHAEYVHKGLTRHFAVFLKEDALDPPMGGAWAN